MNRMLFDRLLRPAKTASLFAFGTAVSVLFSMLGQAGEFEKGDVSLDLDTTVPYSLTWRVDDRDSRLTGLGNGGRALLVNGDVGNLNDDTSVARHDDGSIS